MDDVDSFLDKRTKEVVQNILDSVLETGRHHAITLLVCTHRHTNGRATSLLLAEITHVVLFPASMNAGQMRYLLERTIGMDIAQIRELKYLKGRSVVLQKTHPQLIIGARQAYLLNQDHHDLERVMAAPEEDFLVV